MRTSASLILIMLVTWVALSLQSDSPGVDRAMIGLAVGFLILGAWLTGILFKNIGLPRVSGYIVFGLIVGPSAWELLLRTGWLPTGDDALPGLPFISGGSDGVLNKLNFAKDLAIALIAITAGGEIKFEWLRGQLRRITAITVVGVIGVALAIGGTLAIVQFGFGFNLIDIEAEPSTTMAIIFIGLLALIAAGNSPSIAIAVLNELRADGPLSRTTLAVTVCKDLLLIVLFATLLAVSKGVLGGGEISGTFALAVAVQLGGSLLLGAVFGFIMAMIVSRLTDHLVFFIVGACFFFALLGEPTFHIADQHVHLKPLLIALAAGITMQNATPERAAPLFHTIEQMSLPIYCLFFAVAGAQLQLTTFTNLAVAMTVVGIVAVRAASVWGLIGLTGRWLGLDKQWRGKLWLCLLPQSGVTLALAAILVAGFTSTNDAGVAEVEPWAGALNNLLLGLVAIHALVGPIAYEWALKSAGEAGKAEGDAGH